MSVGEIKTINKMEEQGQCGICLITGPLELIQKHFEEEHITPDSENHENDNCTTGENVQDMRWSPDHVLLLIRLVEKHDQEFQSTIKKNVWLKIAQEMETITQKKFTYDQVDNKWKGLKKTYKKIKDHNNKSGNDSKKWQFFNAMDSFMGKKPEVEPVATCSSDSSTVRINGELRPQSSPASPSSTILKKRRRQENAIETRHKEKMTKYDKFLKLFKRSVEHQIGMSISSDED